MKLILSTLLAFVLASSCTKKSSISNSDAGGEAPISPGSFSTAAKLNAGGDCVDPELDEIKQGVQIMLCDGTLAEGTLALVPASEICNTASQAGVDGTADCSGGSLQSLLPSGIYRDKGGSPAQMSLADELAAGDLATLYASGYREVPLINQDDDGYTGPSIDKVTRDSASEWQTGTVDRFACGMGIATVEARIADCEESLTVTRSIV